LAVNQVQNRVAAAGLFVITGRQVDAKLERIGQRLRERIGGQ
jgi:hypothetical protein